MGVECVEEVVNGFGGWIEWGCRRMGEGDFSEEVLVVEFVVRRVVMI